MRFDILDKVELKYFSSLTPKRYVFNDTFPITDAYGMYDDETPIGVMLMSHNKDRMVITWIYVSKAYRDMGIGDFLLAAAFVEAKDRGVSQVIAYLSEKNISKDDSQEIEPYFREHLFKETKDIPDINGGGKILIAEVGDFDNELTLAEMIETIS